MNPAELVLVGVVVGHVVRDVARGILGVAQPFLDLALGLLALALGLSLGVVGGMPPRFLDLAGPFLDGTFDSILVHDRSSHGSPAVAGSHPVSGRTQRASG